MSLVADLTPEAAVPPASTAYGGSVVLSLKEQYSETDGSLLHRYMEWEVTLGPFSQEESANPVTIAFFDAEQGERGDEILRFRRRVTFYFSNKPSGETFVFDGSLHPWDVELDGLLRSERVYFAVFIDDVEALRGLVREVP